MMSPSLTVYILAGSWKSIVLKHSISKYPTIVVSFITRVDIVYSKLVISCSTFAVLVSIACVYHISVRYSSSRKKTLKHLLP